jgi:penicillin-binding protein 2
VSDRSRLRLVVLRVLVISLLATLLGRLWYLQVLAGPEYQQAAADNQVRDIVAAAPRGLIVDDTGRAMATNRTALVIAVDRIALARQSDHGVAVLHRLADLLHVTYQSLADKIQLCGPDANAGCWNGSPYEPIPVSELKNDPASTRLALQILDRQEDFPGVSAKPAAVRTYVTPLGARASHVLGYLGPISPEELAKLPKAEQDPRRSDYVGRTGLEAEYDDYLRGQPGITQVAVDHLGAVTDTLRETAPQAGANLVTSLNAYVQVTLEKALEGAVKQARSLPLHGGGGPADFAAGVVLDAKTGHVVAMGSYPSYDPSLWDGGRIDAKQYTALRKADGTPLLDKAFQSAYPPGSSFKLVSTAGLLHDGMASTGGSYDCSSSFQNKHNFEGESAGVISLHRTIVISCDTVYYRLAYNDWLRDNRLVQDRKKPIEGVQRVARLMGIGVPPGVDLPNATTGHIADRNNTKLTWQSTRKDYCVGAKNKSFTAYHRALDAYYCRYGGIFQPGDQMNEDIGQGTVLVSPLQLAVAYAALANGGTVFQPRIGQAIVSPSGKLIKTLNAPVRGHLPLSKDELDYIRTAMYGVTTENGGTGHGAFAGFPMHKVLVGGKTGTAEVDVEHNIATAWFASFAGLAGQAPRFVTVIMVNKGGQGGVVAAPAVRKVWDAVFGVEGKKAAFPTGAPPRTLPKIGPQVASGAGASAPSPGADGTTTIGALPPAEPVLRRRWATSQRRTL